ncbi:aldehyde dehydrogenase family protein, partial [Mesorhizobium sp.]
MSAHFARPHRHEALDRLADRRLLRDLGYVGGYWTAGQEAASFEVTDPATGATVAFVAALDGRQTTEAIDAASRAFPAWRSALPQERSKILRKWFDLIIAAKGDLALLMTLEQGKPLKESLGEIDYAASFVEWYA